MPPDLWELQKHLLHLLWRDGGKNLALVRITVPDQTGAVSERNLVKDFDFGVTQKSKISVTRTLQSLDLIITWQ